jgi:hypothetical protein
MKAIMGTRTPAVENVKNTLRNGNSSRAITNEARDVTSRFTPVETIATIIELRKYLGRPETLRAFTKFWNCQTAGKVNGEVSISKLVLNADIVSHTMGNIVMMKYAIRRIHFPDLAVSCSGVFFSLERIPAILFS